MTGREDPATVTGPVDAGALLARMRRRIFDARAVDARNESPLSLPRAQRHDIPPDGATFGHVNDFLAFHDEAFVLNAYRHILGREPDPEGWVHYLVHLRSARLDKVEILGRMRLSAEGRHRGHKVRGLMPVLALRGVLRTPLVGPALRWLHALLLLPGRLHASEQLHGYALAQLQQASHAHDALADAVEEAINLTRQTIAELRRTTATTGMAEALDTRLGRIGEEVRRLDAIRGELDEVRTVLEGVGRDLDRARAARRDPARDALYAQMRRDLHEDPAACRRRVADVLAELEADPGRPLRALEVACGAGQRLRVLQDLGADVTGLEANPELEAEARSQGLDVLGGDEVAAMAALGRGEFDLVMVLESPQDTQPVRLAEMVEQAARILRPGGLLFIDLARSPCSEQAVAAGANPRQLEWMLQRAGLEVARRQPPGWPLRGRSRS